MEIKTAMSLGLTTLRCPSDGIISYPVSKVMNPVSCSYAGTELVNIYSSSYAGVTGTWMGSPNDKGAVDTMQG